METAVKTKPGAKSPKGVTAKAVSKAATPQGCTNIKLRQLMRQVARHYEAEVGPTGLRGTQYSLLSYIVKLGAMRPVDMAAAMRIDASTLSRNLRPLIDKGWIEMASGPDARSRMVVVTEAGKAKRAEAQRRWHVAQLDMNKLLGDERVIALHALLDEASQILADAQQASDNDNTGEEFHD